MRHQPDTAVVYPKAVAQTRYGKAILLDKCKNHRGFTLTVAGGGIQPSEFEGVFLSPMDVTLALRTYIDGGPGRDLPDEYPTLTLE